MTIPKCFVSYSWDSDSHKNWVRNLCEKLRENGVDVVLDQWHLQLGSNLTHFMEESIRNSDFILLICTPQFAEKSNAGKGGVGYEKSIVTGEIFYGINRPEKFVPILRAGSANESLPSYLKSKVFANFVNDSIFDESLLELLRHIHKSPSYKPPPVGPKPVAILGDRALSIHKDNVISTKSISVYCERCGAQPGSQSRCPGYSSHDFVSGSGSGIIYCERCGALAGKPSSCPGYSSHDFVSGSDSGVIYCERCGAQPGSQSKCPGYSSHDFVSGSDSGIIYCERCGALAGKPSKCPGFSSHDFVSR